MAVEAQLDILQTRTRRGTPRRAVTLRGRGAGAEGKTTDVLIHNLSESGVLLESTAALAVGEKIVIDLPDLERISAKVVWASGNLFGCAFDRPVPRSAVSAAQLRSLPGERPSPGISEAHAPSDDPETFGARLKRLRQRRGLSLVDFARQVNVSRPTVWSWEAGKTSPRESKIPALLAVLGASEAEIYARPDEPMAEFPSAASAYETSLAETELQGVIREAKARIAAIAGTSADRVKLVIEV